MTTAKITNSDRAAIIREAWNRAYLAAVLAVEPVRRHIGVAMRSAWADFRNARAEGVIPEEFTAAYEEQRARAGRAEARAYLKGLLAKKAASSTAPVVVEAVEEAPAPEKGQLSLLKWIVDDAIRAGEPGLYAVDQVEPVAPPLVTAPARAAPVAEPTPVQLCILDLIPANVPESVEPEVVGIPETAPADQDDDEVLDEVVIEQVVDPRQELIARIARNDEAMKRLEEDIKMNVADFGLGGSGLVDRQYDRLDDLHTNGLNLRDDLKDLDLATAPMVSPAHLFPSFNAIR